MKGHYDFTDALKLLRKIGVPYLTSNEAEVFISEFKKLYESDEGHDLLTTTVKVYAEILPFKLRVLDTPRAAKAADAERRVRIKYLDQKLSGTELESRIQEGEPIDRILASGV